LEGEIYMSKKDKKTKKSKKSKEFRCDVCGRNHSCPTCGRKYKSEKQLLKIMSRQKINGEPNYCGFCKSSLGKSISQEIARLDNKN
jgi:uncharacterized CHY-type Zn-finger protein